uniref:NYN domain-containing protein n=2 Tax=Noccaea caerulescens TaxID=107243 RepID=A0A1J3EMQ1_NOCCA
MDKDLSCGEDVEDLSEFITDDIGYRNTEVFWDLVRCPIPTRACNKSVKTSIRAALGELGLYACVGITAYGGSMNHSKDDLRNAGILHEPQGELVADLILYARTWGKPRNLMVIPKPDPDSDLDRALTWLKERGYDVLSVKPPDDEDSPQDDLFLQYAQLILGCTYGLYEGKPIIRGRRKMKDIHVIQDFSKPITFEKGATAGVFWNLEDFPFPAGAGWTPDDIYKKIESAFRADGYELSNMLIWAYVDDKEGSWGGDFLRNKTWKSSIYFLPGGGDKSARRNRMLHDIALWESDVFTCSHGFPFPATLVIVSDKDKVRADKVFSHRLRMMIWNQWNVWFLTPTPTVKADDSNWLTSVSEDVYAFPE